MRVWRRVIIGVLVLGLALIMLFVLASYLVINCDCGSGLYDKTVTAISGTNDWVNTAVAQTATAKLDLTTKQRYQTIIRAGDIQCVSGGK